MRDYKVDDWVIFINKKASDKWKIHHEIPLYGKLAKIINIHKSDNTYLLEFKENIKGHAGILSNIRGKVGHCLWCDQNEFKLLINTLKFKKWIKG